MCTRFHLDPGAADLAELAAQASRSALSAKFAEARKPLLTSGEVRPTNVVPVVAPNRKRERSVFPMRWGFRHPKGALLVNARSETAALRPAFAESWQTRRCAVPFSWYYEWTRLMYNLGRGLTGEKYMLRPQGNATAWLAGLYRMEDGLPCFTVLTRDAVAEIRFIHDRMPVMLPKDMIDDWISPCVDPRDVLRYAITDVVAEKAEKSA